jgi:hypothetical protein
LELQRIIPNLLKMSSNELFFIFIRKCGKFLWMVIIFKPGVANPNRFLGRIWKNIRKYLLFGLNFDKNCEKKHSKYLKIPILDWATKIPFWAAG